jgi:hypothetical protein
MTADTNIAGLGRLLELFNIADKKSAKKHCRDLVITSKDLYHIIIAGRTGILEPYRYACHFANIVPPHLPPSAKDHEALQTNGVGPLSPRAAKAMSKVMQIFKERRVFAAHLFFTPSHDFWHLLYFDQRDTDTSDNHWTVGGSHIHYSRESFCREPLPVMWRAVCEQPPRPPSSTHVRYEEHLPEG